MNISISDILTPVRHPPFYLFMFIASGDLLIPHSVSLLLS